MLLQHSERKSGQANTVKGLLLDQLPPLVGESVAVL